MPTAALATAAAADRRPRSGRPRRFGYPASVPPRPQTFVESTLRGATARLLGLLRYRLERFLLGGPHFRLAFIAGVIGAFSILGGLAIVGTGPESLGEAVWWAFLRLTDPGYLGDDEGPQRRFVSTVLTVSGYVLFMGALVAILTTWLHQTIHRLETGTTPIALTGHVLVVGANSRTPTILRELLASEERVRRFLARHRARQLRVVLLANQVGTHLRQELRDRLRGVWRDRQVVLRSGSALRVAHLARADFAHASAIILAGDPQQPGGPREADAATIKSVLSMATYAASITGELPLVVCELFDGRKARIARRAYRGGEIDVVRTDELLASLFAQNVRHPGLSRVYADLLTHDRGSTVYVREAPELAGRSFRQVRAAFPGGLLLGVARPVGERGQSFDAILAPPAGFRARASDRFVLIAADFRSTAPELPRPEAQEPGDDRRQDDGEGIGALGGNGGLPRVPDGAAPPGPRQGRPDGAHRDGPDEPMPPTAASTAAPGARRPRRRILILGFNHKVPALLGELDRHEEEDTEVVVVTGDTKTDRREWMRGRQRFERLRVRFRRGDRTVPASLSKLIPSRFDNVLVVSRDDYESSAEADADTVATYLLLRDLLGEEAREAGARAAEDPGHGDARRPALRRTGAPHVLVELMDAPNRALFEGEDCEVLVSPTVVGRVLAQVTLRRELRPVYDELLGPRGAEFDFRLPEDYGIEAGDEQTFGELEERVAALGDVLVGIHDRRGFRGGTVTIHPGRGSPSPLGPHRELLVITERRPAPVPAPPPTMGAPRGEGPGAAPD